MLLSRSWLLAGGRSSAAFPRTTLRTRASRLDVAVVAERVHNAFSEVCFENQGRPAAAALSDFVLSSLLTTDNSISVDTVLLELEYGAGNVDEAGFRLTSSDRSYRRQWVLTVLMTQALFAAICERRPVERSTLDSWKMRDASLYQIVGVTLQQLVTQKTDQQIRFDRSLATGGVSGGVATQCIEIAPQFVPLSQLVLLTAKHLQERKSEGNQPS